MYIIHMSALKMCHALYFYEKPDFIVLEKIHINRKAI